MGRYRVAPAAKADMAAILRHSLDAFGEDARRRYAKLLVTAIREVAAAPDRPGSVDRPELGDGVRSWHLRSSRDHVPADDRVGKPRHVLVYRLEGKVLVVARILYDTMDLKRHLPVAPPE